MMAPAWEGKRAHRWIIEYEGIDTWLAKTFARPSLNMGEVPVEYINTRRYFQGKFEWQPIEMSIYDAIQPSATQKIMEWVRLGHENATGRVGYKEFYVAKDFKLKMLDGPGNVVEQWDIINAFPTNVNFNTLDYGNAEVMMVNCTLRYDAAILSY